MPNLDRKWLSYRRSCWKLGDAGVEVAAVVVFGEVLQSLGPDGMMSHRSGLQFYRRGRESHPSLLSPLLAPAVVAVRTRCPPPWGQLISWNCFTLRARARGPCRSVCLLLVRCSQKMCVCGVFQLARTVLDFSNSLAPLGDRGGGRWCVCVCVCVCVSALTLSRVSCVCVCVLVFTLTEDRLLLISFRRGVSGAPGLFIQRHFTEYRNSSSFDLGKK